MIPEVVELGWVEIPRVDFRAHSISVPRATNVEPAQLEDSRGIDSEDCPDFAEH